MESSDVRSFSVRKRFAARWRTGLVSGALLMVLGAPAAQAGEVERWGVAIDSALALIPEPWASSRHAAVAYVAMSDALNALDRRFEPFAFDARANGASQVAAVATAAHTALSTALREYEPLTALVPVARIRVIYDDTYAAALATVPDGPAKSAGIELGRRAAEAIVPTLAGDQVARALLFPYTPGTDPGDYQFLQHPSGLRVVFAGYAALIGPMVLDRADQFRPPPPLAINSSRYAADANEVKRIGGIDSDCRSHEESEIADFWYENSLTAWSRIGRTLAARERLDEWRQARLFALLALSIADGSLAHFEAKYLYNLWRPITAITAANTGNRRVESDPHWESYCETPPTPEYASGHSLNGAAAAVILEDVFGRNVRFRADSHTLPGVTREFRSFQQASLENAESRIFCGIHFRESTIRGRELGTRVARHILGKVLRPVRH